MDSEKQDEEQWLSSRQARWLKPGGVLFIVKMLVLGGYLFLSV